jgi:hypothetical protein
MEAVVQDIGDAKCSTVKKSMGSGASLPHTRSPDGHEIWQGFFNEAERACLSGTFDSENEVTSKIE